MRYQRNTEEANFWAGYADCMLALFMIALLLWILSAGITAFTDEAAAKKLSTTEDQIAKLKEQIEELKRIIEAKDFQLNQLNADYDKLIALKGTSAKLVEELKKIQDENTHLKEQLKKLQTMISNLEKENQNLKRDYDELVVKFSDLERKHKELTGALEGNNIEQLLVKMAKLEKELNDKPPVINLTEGVAKEFSFPSGSADLPQSFEDRLKMETFPELQTILKNYERIDTLEIVGHTDGRPLNKQGNLDTAIPRLMNADLGRILLKPGSNTDLGLMRALAIRNAWLKWIETRQETEQSSLKSITVRCYSAAQTVPPLAIDDNHDWLAENATARRIEIRFIQLK